MKALKNKNEVLTPEKSSARQLICFWNLKKVRTLNKPNLFQKKSVLSENYIDFTLLQGGSTTSSKRPHRTHLRQRSQACSMIVGLDIIDVTPRQDCYLPSIWYVRSNTRLSLCPSTDRPTDKPQIPRNACQKWRWKRCRATDITMDVPCRAIQHQMRFPIPKTNEPKI